MADTRTQKQKNRAVRQESLREQLQAQGHLQYVVDLITKLEDADTKLDSTMVQRYKTAMDARFKLIAKYIPDLRSVEVTGEDGGALTVQIVRFGDDQASSE